jgi:dTDP-4-amino-4,6-dideoxygalactose transaminase/predicted SAM-dependent methyltransferase
VDDFIPVSNPKANYIAHQKEIDEAVEKVLSSGQYILGDRVKEFEEEFARYLGVSFCIGVASGTDALSIALKAVGVNPGDEVITVSHTAIATIVAIEQVGAEPVFIDINECSFCMDAYRIEAAIMEKTKAIVPVHIYGQPVPMSEIMFVANKYNLKVVEDCAQAVGAYCWGRWTGSWGHAAAFSFYPTKNLGAIGDGGMIATDDKEIMKVAKQLREYGWNENHVCERKGINSRLDELQASILLAKLKTLDEDNGRRRRVASCYLDAIEGNEQIIPQKEDIDTANVYHLFVIRTKERFHLRRFLMERGIGSAFHYPLPIHLQPIYKDKIKRSKDLPGTEKVSCEILSLPMYPELTGEQVERVCSALREWMNMPPLTWESIKQRDSIRLYAGDLPPLRIEYDEDLIALSFPEDLTYSPNHTLIKHDITKPMPLPDNSVDYYQSEDVFEHIEYDKLVLTMNEIHRILKWGGLFRLSIPDYGYDFHQKDVVRDKNGEITFDPKAGVTSDGPEHKWFPTISNVKDLIERTNFKNSPTKFLHYYDKDGDSVLHTVDYSKGFVWRTPDNMVQDGSYRPISLVVDFTK